MDLNVEDRTLGKIVLSESVLEDQINLDQVGVQNRFLLMKMERH